MQMSDRDRHNVIVQLTGLPRYPCDLCGTPVTFANLSAWDEGDGQVHCTAHGPLAERFEEETKEPQK